jgi:hypothetical protein
MAKWGKVNYKQFQELQKRMEKLQSAASKQEFMEACAKELAARLLSKVIKRTPVRKQEDCPPGVKGGTLRRGWTSKTYGDAMSGGRSSAKDFVDSLKVSKVGNIYQIEIINPVEYASYVEFGHRTRNHKGWVPGRFMLTISEQELDSQAPKILEQKLMKYLGECFNGK